MCSEQARVRVLHASALNRVGGVETVFAAYLAHPASRAFEHDVLLLHGACHRDLAGTIERWVGSVRDLRRWHGLRVPRLFHGWQIRRILREVSPAVVVMTNVLRNDALWRAVLASPARIVYHEHGAAWFSGDSKEVAYRLGRADAILCNSRAAKRMLELQWNILGRPAQVVHNPLRADLDLSAFAPKPADPRLLRLGMAGRLKPIKGFATGLHALRILLDQGVPCCLEIAGIGECEGELKSLAHKLGLEAHVQFRGYVRNMAAFFGGIDVFLCPSIREPLGNVAVEAGFCGCPTLCAAVDGLPEVVVDGVTGFCIPPRVPAAGLGGVRLVYAPQFDALRPPMSLAPEDIAERVRRLWENPPLLARMGRAAHAHIASEFSRDAYVSAVNACLRRVADSDGTPR